MGCRLTKRNCCSFMHTPFDRISSPGFTADAADSADKSRIREIRAIRGQPPKCGLAASLSLNRVAAARQSAADFPQSKVRRSAEMPLRGPWFLAVVTLLVLASSLFAGPRDALWKQVDEAVKKGLPKTAITNLEPIIQGALKD